jgi:hypothetical protein
VLRGAYHPRTSIGIASAFEGFQQKKEFLGKHGRGLPGCRFNSLRRLHNGVATHGKWFREYVGMVRRTGAGVEVGLSHPIMPVSAGLRSAPPKLVSRMSGAARRSHGSANGERDEAGAKQDKAGNGHSEEAVGSEFFTHGSPPVVCPCPNNTTVALHSQKNFRPRRYFDPG